MSWAEAKWTVDQILPESWASPQQHEGVHCLCEIQNQCGSEISGTRRQPMTAPHNLLCSVGGVMIRMSEESYPIQAYRGYAGYRQ